MRCCRGRLLAIPALETLKGSWPISSDEKRHNGIAFPIKFVLRYNQETPVTESSIVKFP